MNINHENIGKFIHEVATAAGVPVANERGLPPVKHDGRQYLHITKQDGEDEVSAKADRNGKSSMKEVIALLTSLATFLKTSSPFTSTITNTQKRILKKSFEQLQKDYSNKQKGFFYRIRTLFSSKSLRETNGAIQDLEKQLKKL